MRDAADGLPVAVVGAGYMGGGMAQVFALAGHPCVIAEATPEGGRQARERIIAEARTLAEQGLFPVDSADLIAERTTVAPSMGEGVAAVGYIAEAVPESRSLKLAVLRTISRAADAKAIIGSNTSAMPIGSLAEAVAGPERFLGVHWMNPAPFVPCVEIVPSSLTDPGVVDQTVALMMTLGKVPTRVGDAAGFVASRLQYALLQEAIRLVDEGVASPQDIDRVVTTSFGSRLPFFGPFASADLAGLDVYAGGFESLAAAFGDRFAPPRLLVEHVAAGDCGVKTGGGLTGMTPDRLPEVLDYRNRAYALLGRLREDLGPVPGT